ncbi:MAG: hypothetical protein RRB13_16170 [bacterium]|nr:hypothetical protein [bacterium]
MELKTISTKSVRQRLGGHITELKFTDTLFLIEKNGEIVGGLVSPAFLEAAGIKLPAREDKLAPKAAADTKPEPPAKDAGEQPDPKASSEPAPKDSSKKAK